MKEFLLVIILLIAGLIGNAQTNTPSSEDENATKVERVFPNPIDDHLFVEITSDDFSKASIVLMDILGNPVQQWEVVEIMPGTQKIRLNLNKLHSGLYLLKVKIGEQNFVNRLRKV
ncbi:T9SS type A sorting domain-containing protein [Mangrovibacterium lignilyticum]|uniref:T9SS type A sorting domain-containing protein n=1 Tax=Mangrovibacterium lignilyticum TaxID=2668052 RepID=UPI0013D85D5B|nr:T9SS type A sorting domain-containing protein [Mangrovibacterium lignilyticum]